MQLKDLTPRPLQPEFYDPSQFRRWCVEQEKDYRYVTFDSSQVVSTAVFDAIDCPDGLFDLGSQDLTQIDDMTGFTAVLRELNRRAKGLPLPPVDEMRVQYYREHPIKLRALTKESHSEVVGITDAAHVLVLPTQLAMWSSLLRERLGLRAEHQVLSDGTSSDFARNVHLRFVPQDLVDMNPRVGDPAQFALSVDYSPSRGANISVSEEMLRLVCSNFSVMREMTTSAMMVPTHDLGAVRSRFEKQVTTGLDKMRAFEKTVKRLLNQRPKREVDLNQWLAKRRVPEPTRNAILTELREAVGLTSEYDVFNAITAARTRMPGYTPEDEIALGRLAGEYLKSTQTPEKTTWTPRLVPRLPT